MFVETSNVVLDYICQFLNLYWLVVKDCFTLAEQRELLQLGVGVGDVTADGLGDVDELGVLLEAPGHRGPGHAVHLAAPETLDRVPELQGAISAAGTHPEQGRNDRDIKMYQLTYIIPPLKLLPPSFPFALGLGLG